MKGDPKMRKAFGALLKKTRLSAGLTQAQLAGAIGVSDAYIVRLEKGVQGPPPPDRCHQLATALGDRDGDLVRMAIKGRSGYLYERIYGGDGLLKDGEDPWLCMPEAVRRNRVLVERICSVLERDPAVRRFLEEAVKLCEARQGPRGPADEEQPNGAR